MLGVTAMSLVLAVATATMELRSSDFSPNGTIPARSMATDCGGMNRPPALRWGGAPSTAKSFALILHDPDAPLPGGFYHWVIYNIPATARGLPAAAVLAHDQLGITSRGAAGYYGPCPPPGPAHHYVFTLYALDLDRIGAPSPLDAMQLEARIKDHVLAHANLEASASHP
ncbi:MAG TPA: YbhB/YbcL family Raf kinase inhibitor-like protein [Candidatus Nitrosotalea sp.]|nr:YbhB/YbcL family Raf kinase inhibitor-like protein [Candidatus Nitrosotalea sp.]